MTFLIKKQYRKKSFWRNFYHKEQLTMDRNTLIVIVIALIVLLFVGRRTSFFGFRNKAEMHDVHHDERRALHEKHSEERHALADKTGA